VFGEVIESIGVRVAVRTLVGIDETVVGGIEADQAFPRIRKAVVFHVIGIRNVTAQRGPANNLPVLPRITPGNAHMIAVVLLLVENLDVIFLTLHQGDRCRLLGSILVPIAEPVRFSADAWDAGDQGPLELAGRGGKPQLAFIVATDPEGVLAAHRGNGTTAQTLPEQDTRIEAGFRRNHEITGIGRPAKIDARGEIGNLCARDDVPDLAGEDTGSPAIGGLGIGGGLDRRGASLIFEPVGNPVVVWIA